MIDTYDDNDSEYERPNKSKLKRESHALLDLARKLIDLPETKWSETGLPEQLMDELYQCKTMKQFGAKKRQLKLLAKLLRDVDITQAVRMVEDAVKSQAEVNVTFHRVERWRGGLLAGEASVLTAFLGQYEGVDVQALNQLIRNAKHEISVGKPPKSSKLLFKMIRDIVG